MTTLHFLGPDGALPAFPSESDLRRLGTMTSPALLDAFHYDAWQAKDRIWILDLHFVEHGYYGLLHALASAMVLDVRIVSEPVSKKPQLLKQLRDAIDLAWNRGRPATHTRPAPTKLEWYDRLVRRPATFPYAHDRFALVDDALWHFGYAACGSGNCLSAASGPWHGTEAVDFFEDLYTRI